MNPQIQPIQRPDNAPVIAGTPVSLAAELQRGHVLLMKAGAVANLLLDQSNVLGGGIRSETALAKIMAAQGMAGLSARLGERLHAVRRACGRLAAGGIDPAAMTLPAMRVSKIPSAAPVRAKLHAAPGQSRGRLKHGNPAGDYLAAPRCGAGTRSGCSCRQPAMANGRCRFHGGKSTGARTAEGLRRCRNIRFRHGGRSRPVIDLRSRAVHGARRLSSINIVLRAGKSSRNSSNINNNIYLITNKIDENLPESSVFPPLRAGSGNGIVPAWVDCTAAFSVGLGEVRPGAGMQGEAGFNCAPARSRDCSSTGTRSYIVNPSRHAAGHGVDRSIPDFHPALRNPGQKINRTDHRKHRVGRADLSNTLNNNPFSVPSVSSVVNPVLPFFAGHGVDRSFRDFSGARPAIPTVNPSTVRRLSPT